MKFLVFLCLVLAFFIQIQKSLQAPTYHNKNHTLRFDENNFEVPDDSQNESDDNDDDERAKQGVDRNLFLIDKTDLKNLVSNENAVLETLKSVLDNLPKRRNKRNDLDDFFSKLGRSIEKRIKTLAPVVAGALVSKALQN
uniref:Uncharacterized protein n=1 Tax=Panagrolaimus davidi TaxID=227884 RepID=A0A914PN00_9BILA